MCVGMSVCVCVCVCVCVRPTVPSPQLILSAVFSYCIEIHCKFEISRLTAFILFHFSQEDFIFIMDRKIWLSQHLKIWFTDMLPNIGLFLCRGNEKTAKVFSLAWSKYDVRSIVFCFYYLMLFRYVNH